MNEQKRVLPIRPEEVDTGKHIPDEVIEAFNELIAEKYIGYAVVGRENAIKRILTKLPDVERMDIINKGWLNIEGIYASAGWDVKYDKPGYNESYDPYFTFTRKT
jgi:hypothetical protein